MHKLRQVAVPDIVEDQRAHYATCQLFCLHRVGAHWLEGPALHSGHLEVASMGKARGTRPDLAYEAKSKDCMHASRVCRLDML